MFTLSFLVNNLKCNEHFNLCMGEDWIKFKLVTRVPVKAKTPHHWLSRADGYCLRIYADQVYNRVSPSDSAAIKLYLDRSPQRF